jgi:hypothetical protein
MKLEEAIWKARELAPQFGSGMDGLNALFLQAQNGLAALKLGVRAAVPLGNDRTSLVFGKFNNVWILAVETDAGARWAPLVNESKELRLFAAQELHKLVIAMVEAAVLSDSVVAQAHNQVAALVKCLRESTP